MDSNNEAPMEVAYLGQAETSNKTQPDSRTALNSQYGAAQLVLAYRNNVATMEKIGRAISTAYAPAQ